MKFLFLQVVYKEPSYSLLFIVIVATILLYFTLWRYRKKVQDSFGAVEIINKIAPLRNSTFFWLRILCIVQCFFFAALALMQPALHLPQKQQEKNQEAPLQESYDEVVFIMDVSSSMSSHDASDHETRFNRAKQIAEAVVEHLGGVSISLYGFAGTCENEVPSTMDYLYFRILLESLRLNETHVAGTNFSALIDEMEKKYLKTQLQKKRRFILLTDGEDTTILDFDPQEKRKAEERLMERLALFKKADSAWDVVGLGSGSPTVIPGLILESKPVYSTMQADFVKMLSVNTGGHDYFDNSLSLARIVDGLVANISREKRGDQESELNGAEESTSSLFGYPLFAAFLFLALAIIVPERRRTNAKLRDVK